MAKDVFGFSVWDQKYMTDSEKTAVTQARENAAAGRISWSDANRIAEDIRSRYGYSGGTEGKEYFFKPTVSESYTSENRDAVDAQQKKLDGMTYEKFTQSEDYGALMDKYTAAGKKAMDDTTGAIAARTGGIASSYAATAAGQAFQQYMEGLDDAAKELYQQEYAKERQRLQDLKAAEETDYARWLDRVALNQQNDQTRLSVDTDLRAQEDAREQTAYERGIYADETAYNRGQTAKTDAQNEVIGYLQMGGKLADLPQELIAATGLSSAYLQMMESNLNTQTQTVKEPEITSEILNKVTTFTNPVELASYLDGLTADKKISEEQADYLYGVYMSNADRVRSFQSELAGFFGV